MGKIGIFLVPIKLTPCQNITRNGFTDVLHILVAPSILVAKLHLDGPKGVDVLVKVMSTQLILDILIVLGVALQEI